MESAYEPKKYEEEIYKLWEESGFFNPDKLPGGRKEKYVITIPPPNITGSLHMGHTLNAAIQDILIRFHRMKGEKTLWLPGTDHAGIATQNVVEKGLAKEGLTRQQLGREKFIEQVWLWKNKYGNLILEQLKKIGSSCDWSRTRFTLDEKYSKAVQTAFVHYYKKGYLYRGPRIVNWCPRCSTAISDIEIKYREEKGKLWYIKYPFKNDQKKFVMVATTRPETMLGDTAIAVNPKDERYKNVVGQTVILPIMNREIPIIASDLVDLQFGTGAVKITPAHDNVDWAIGKKFNLEIINVIGPDGRMTEFAGKYVGLKVLEAREKIVEELKSLNLLEKEEDYMHQISLCDRCSTPIEPQVSTQWFIKMKELARPAINAVKDNKIKITPERYVKIYLDWLEKVEDWCISRQLWWGHRLPVWHCQTANEIKNQKSKIKNIENCPSVLSSGSKEKLEIENSSVEPQFIVSIKKPEQCPFCKKCDMQQSTDVLDTWFSSALWPFATLGWPDKTVDLKNYYPTSLITTAQEIFYLWVARMVFSSLEFLKKIPFEEVYIHSTILNFEGRRMSKSLGTGIDPLQLIDKYGADATRFGLISQTSREQQAIRFDERAILAARNFVNKLWNIARFIQMQCQSEFNLPASVKPITMADRWILSRLNYLIDSTAKKIENYELGEAAKELYEFTWHELADWYLEITKFQNENPNLQNNTVDILKFAILNLLKILHPFIPFVTEKIYSQLTNSKKLLIIEDWPDTNKKLINQKVEEEFEKIKKMVIKIRNWKIEQKIPFKEIVEYNPESEDKKTLNQVEIKNLVEKLAKVKSIL